MVLYHIIQSEQSVALAIGCAQSQKAQILTNKPDNNLEIEARLLEISDLATY